MTQRLHYSEDGEIRITARNLEGDHLAIVSHGACGAKDGCGIGLSKNDTITISLEDNEYVQREEILKLKKELIKEQIKKEELND